MMANQDQRPKVFPAWFRPAMAVLLVIVSFAALGGMLWISAPDDRADLVTYLFGFITGSCIAPVVNFVFGSSTGSAEKQAVQERRLDAIDSESVQK
jgi:FtsH-binding integral membrane protein